MHLRFGLFLTLAVFAWDAAVAAEVSFNRDIRPILSENCFQCHGPDAESRFAGLRLDDRASAVENGAIHPGEPESSKLIERIRSADAAKAMPPAWSDKSLDEDQKQLIEDWIREGALYQGHWAYLAPERPAAPAGPVAIDALLDKAQREQRLEPVALAARRTLLRRLSFDLTGLPPTSAEVQAFAAGSGAGSWRKAVERVLASPAFGERMAVQWLDLVRYADTIGYHSDANVNVYPYRDYVIDAFNSNKPFDVFTREQLAGDLLPDATDWQRVASAYNRIGRMTSEGGSQEKEYLIRYAADRVRTTATAWLGSTLGCAECHDHKFDPFAQKDFYQMAAFFADIEEKGVYEGRGQFLPSIRVLPEGKQQEADALGDRLAELGGQNGQARATKKALREFAGYLREASSWSVLTPTRAWNDCTHPNFDRCESMRVETAGAEVKGIRLKEKVDKAMVRVEMPFESGRASALMLELLAGGDDGKFHLSQFRIEVLDGRSARTIPVRAFVADHETPESPLYAVVDGNWHTGWGGEIGEGETRRSMFVLEEPIEGAPGRRLLITVSSEGRPSRRVPERFRLSSSSAAFPELLDTDLRDAAKSRRPSRAQTKLLRAAFEAWTRGNPGWRQVRRMERDRKALLDSADECLIVRTAEPRVVRVLNRGNWMDESGEVVEPQAPHFLQTIDRGKSRLTRLDLADWLVSRENPLTARVFVNRTWALLFGTGLSKTLGDLGSQGEAPLHQDLLDWLAVEFMDSGWDVKHLIRTMVLSDAYQRSSSADSKLRDADPYNRYHARQAPRRIEAEFVRDAALRVSGLLDRTIGGPSAKPYQPPLYYQELNFPKREYEPSGVEGQWRRGLYTHWQRTYLHPSLMAFDAPSREECTAERSVSNTPLQSLALLNDPTYVEAARAFAARILSESGKGFEARLEFAFREAFSRQASVKEKRVVESLLENERCRFAANPSAGSELLGVGLWQAAESLDRSELAAWTSVSRALLNKHEFITRY